jgi:hypothetical protein
MIKSFLLGLHEGFKFSSKSFFAPTILVVSKAWTLLGQKTSSQWLFVHVICPKMQSINRVSAEIWNDLFGPRLLHRLPPERPKSVVVFWSTVRSIGLVIAVFGIGFVVWHERITAIEAVESAMTMLKQSISIFTGSTTN